MRGATWSSGTLEIAAGDVYSTELDFRGMTLLALLVPAAITGTRLRVQARLLPGAPWYNVNRTEIGRDDVEPVGFTATGVTGELVTLDANSCPYPYLRFFFVDNSEDVQTQIAKCVIEYTMKNVSGY